MIAHAAGAVLRTMVVGDVRWWPLGASAVLPACATVTRGTHQEFRVISEPSGAQAMLSSGETCVTPCRLRLPRGDPFRVRLSKAGFDTQVVPVFSHMATGGGARALGNAVLGGLAGVSADASSGALRKLTPNPLKVRLSASAAPPGSSAPMVTGARVDEWVPSAWLV